MPSSSNAPKPPNQTVEPAGVPGTVAGYATSILLARTMEAKLSPPPADLSDDVRGDGAAPSGPLRPPGLEIETDPKKKRRTPPIQGMVDPSQRVRILHALANHELQAAELFAWALLRFPDTEPGFRRGLVTILVEEQKHLALYIKRIEAMGGKFGDSPLSGYFWSKVDEFESPLTFVCSMSLAFENANLDHAIELAAAARAVGDEATARVLDIVHDDEIGHVRFGWKWLRAWKSETDSMSAAWLKHLVWPLRPALARGDVYHPESRANAGIDDADFLSMLERAERPRALYKFKQRDS